MTVRSARTRTQEKLHPERSWPCEQYRPLSEGGVLVHRNGTMPCQQGCARSCRMGWGATGPSAGGETVRLTGHAAQATVLAALQQPAPETFALFDDVMLISEGVVLFHGPRAHVLPFFERLGFACPPRKDPAGFLQEVTSARDQAVRRPGTASGCWALTRNCP